MRVLGLNPTADGSSVRELCQSVDSMARGGRGFHILQSLRMLDEILSVGLCV